MAPSTSKDKDKRPTAIVHEGGLTHRSMARGLLNTDNLPALQNLLKRQPEAYLEEFTAQWNHYQSLRSIFAADLSLDTGTTTTDAVATPKVGKVQQQKLVQLISFVTQLAPSYPEITAQLSRHLEDLLLNHHVALTPDIRTACLRSLILLRNRDVITSEDLLRTLFPLLTITTSSALGTSVQATILQDIKNANLKSKNHRLNRVVQGLLFGIVQKGIDASATKGKVTGKTQALWAVRLAANLWRKGIWTDNKTVSLLALTCFHPHPRVQSSAIRFFLGDLHSAQDGESDQDDSEDQGPDMDKLFHQRKVGKKTRSADKKIRAAAAIAKKKRRDKQNAKTEGSNDQGNANFAALYLLNDAQNFGEKLFDNLSRGDREKRHTIEIKVRLMQLLARVMAAHKLCVLSFYSYVVKYLAPHQAHITLILVSLAQSVHDQTPPDVLTPVVRKVSDAFIHPGVSSQVVAAGLNSIREVCRRQPWAMEETLLEDLVSYRRSKDKGVAAAARGLLSLYRQVNPGMLKKNERGKAGALAIAQGKKAMPFGFEQDQVRGIQGIELLEKHFEGEEMDQDAGWGGWEEDASESEESEDGWIAVSSDEENDFHLSDSDSDDDEETKKVKISAKEMMKERLERKRVERQIKRAKMMRKKDRANRREKGEEVDTSDESGSESDLDPAEHAAALASAAQVEETKISTLATTKILTPADFAKLNELRIAAAEATIQSGGLAGNKAKKALEELKKKRSSTSDGLFVDEGDILGPRKKAKADYEERIASIEKGREDRDKFGSRKGKKNKEVQSSSTNKEKQKGKNFQMVAKSWGVRSKRKASLRDKSKRLRQHIDKAKKRIK